MLRDCAASQPDNTDFLRFAVSSRERVRRWAKDRTLKFAGQFGFARRQYDVGQAAAALAYVVANIGGFEELHGSLADDTSKQSLIELLAFRILGQGHVKLSTNNEGYWTRQRSVDRQFLRERGTAFSSPEWRGNLYLMPGQERSISLHAHPLNILNTFLLEQYAYRKAGNSIRATAGDVVLDGGSCWGDTALYFADQVGAKGKVYAFEFDDTNLDIFRRNLDLNAGLREQIEVIEQALWDRSGEVLAYHPNGPGTSVQAANGSGLRRTTTCAIDDLVSEQKVSRVDFIKLDIEGSELRALRGAERTIRAFRPKLAISVYHRDDDFVVIPNYIASLKLGYELFLDHFTIHQEETILFARAPGPGAGPLRET